MKLFKSFNFLSQIKERWNYDQVDFFNIEGVEYFRNKIFFSLLIFVQILLTPIFIYNMITFMFQRNIFGVIINIIILTLVFMLFKVKTIPEQTSKAIMVISIYLIGIIMLVEAGGYENGFVMILLAIFVAGFFLEKKISSKFIIINMVGFIILTIVLFSGILDDKPIAMLKSTWSLNVIIVQFCGIISFILMNTMFDGLKKQSNQVKEANSKVSISKQRYEEMIANIVDVIIITDPRGNVSYISPNVNEIYGWTCEEFLYRPLLDKIYEDDRPQASLVFKNLIKNQEKREITQVRHYDKNGELRYIDVTLTNLLNDAIVSGVLINYHDVTEWEHYEKKITYMNQHDELTRLYNRAYFNQIKNQLDREENLPVSFISADIDGLKMVNDSFGHQQGDLILKLAAEIFKKSFRKEDVIARVGGDEFYIILRQTDIDVADNLIERTNREIDSYNDQNLNEAHFLSISMGAATKKRMDENIDIILQKADYQMYKVKNLKKNDLNTNIILTLKKILYNKLPDLEEKGQRCANLSQKIGIAIGLSDEELKKLELLSTLGDIGKINIDQSVLLKIDNLTEQDKKEYYRYPEIGYRIAKATPELLPIAECVLAYQERWDGSGYPRGLSEEEIPILSRIRLIAEYYDEFDRGEGQIKSQTLDKGEEFKRAAGSKLDPNLINVLINLL